MSRPLDFPKQHYLDVYGSSLEFQDSSLDISTTDYLVGTSGASTGLGVTDTFSMAIWAKKEGTSTSLHSAFRLGLDAGSQANSIQITTQSASDDNLQVDIRDSAFSLRQLSVWNSVVDGGADTWHHYVLTWDGTVSGLQLYIDGTLTAATTVTANLDGSAMTDPNNRRIDVGGGNLAAAWEGPIYSAAVYDSVVGSSQVTAMYNSGAPRTVDLMTVAGDIAVLPIHYYRVGLGSTDVDFGLDRGTLADVDLTNANLDATDLTSDIPT